MCWLFFIAKLGSRFAIKLCAVWCSQIFKNSYLDPFQTILNILYETDLICFDSDKALHIQNWKTCTVMPRGGLCLSWICLGFQLIWIRHSNFKTYGWMPRVGFGLMLIRSGCNFICWFFGSISHSCIADFVWFLIGQTHQIRSCRRWCANWS